jgi:RNA polymerase sigma-70 factor (ECF subfamily)
VTCRRLIDGAKTRAWNARKSKQLSEDWDCLIRAQRGDESAWQRLVGQYQSRLAALSLLITGSSYAADDVVQETFFRALRSKVSHRSGTVHGYLGTIAYRLALKEVERTKRFTEAIDANQIDDAPSPLDKMLKDERDRSVAIAIRSLSRIHRDVIALRLYGGKSYNEIANLLQVSVGTVKSRMFNAIKSCRCELRKMGVLE